MRSFFDDAVTKRRGELWEKLPKWMNNHRTVRTNIINDVDDYGPGEPWTEQFIDKANLITSVENGVSYGVRYHRPVIDLDMEAALIESSTPGHSHLYINHLIPQSLYWELLNVMARCGLVQRGWVDMAIEHGATSVRLPWIKKNDWYANQADPDAAVKEKMKRLREYREEVARLENELGELGYDADN